VTGRGPIIAIDGPAGVGKSTLARRLAAELGVPYVNTGLMYRALTARALSTGLDVEDGPRLAQAMGEIGFDLDLNENPPSLAVDGEPPGPDLVAPEVEATVSTVSRHPAVRAAMREEQRRLGRDGAVMEGRDIGSVIFPDADVKLFLQGSPEERASRRASERGTEEGIERAVATRDTLDAEVNPFVPAPGAVVVDTTGKSADEVFREALSVIGPRTRHGDRDPTVAVIGRQNVGKSTLVNRLLGAKETIAHEQPGVTRDRIDVPVTWRGRRFVVVDTGGYVARAGGIDALVSRQAERAFADADVVLLVGDVQTGVQDEDLRLAERLRGSTAPVLGADNKVESDAVEPEAAAFHALGLGEPQPISALHGRGSGDLLDKLLDLLPDSEAEDELEGEPRFALVGRPNVGKSSLFNRLVGEERSVVYEEAGTTRDSVDALVQWESRPVRFVDTAGLRRPGRMQGVEYYGLVRAVRAVDRAHVALLVLDATEGLTSEDKHVAERVIEAGRALAVTANKWDLVETGSRDELFKTLTEIMRPFARAPLVRTSALTGTGVNRLPGLLLGLHAAWSRRVPTTRVNDVLQQAQAERPAPRGGPRYRYGTQVSAGPPTFVLFGGRAPSPGYQRYLENRLRLAFDLEGVPIRIRFRPGRRKRPRGT
jgi:GTP-binding protein